VREGSGALKAALRGDWMGHALHPLLTDTVIGTWTEPSAPRPHPRRSADRFTVEIASREQGPQCPRPHRPTAEGCRVKRRGGDGSDSSGLRTRLERRFGHFGEHSLERAPGCGDLARDVADGEVGLGETRLDRLRGLGEKCATASQRGGALRPHRNRAVRDDRAVRGGDDRGALRRAGGERAVGVERDVRARPARWSAVRVRPCDRRSARRGADDAAGTPR